MRLFRIIKLFEGSVRHPAAFIHKLKGFVGTVVTVWIDAPPSSLFKDKNERVN